LCSCRDAARRRCHEFRPDWIGDRFAQDPVDLSLEVLSKIEKERPSLQADDLKRLREVYEGTPNEPAKA
jgi:hypothetical protein